MACLRNGRNVLRQILKDTNIHSSDSDRMMNPLLYACQGVRFRKLESIDKLGKAAQTAPGYFCNHLMPKLLAAQTSTEQVVDEVKVVTVPEEAISRKSIKRRQRFWIMLLWYCGGPSILTRATNDDPIELKSPVTTDYIVAEVERRLAVHIQPENVHLAIFQLWESMTCHCTFLSPPLCQRGRFNGSINTDLSI